MKFCISKIHLGRYRVDMLNDDNQIIQGYDGGSAMVMIFLSQWLFEPEYQQYQRDQRASSDALGQVAIDDMKANPEKYLQPKSLPRG